MKTIFFMIIISLIASCAHQPIPSAYDPPGFFMGIVHGMISPFALIGGIFSDVRVYAFPNSGMGYDWGFMIGLGLLGGGSSRASG